MGAFSLCHRVIKSARSIHVQLSSNLLHCSWLSLLLLPLCRCMLLSLSSLLLRPLCGPLRLLLPLRLPLRLPLCLTPLCHCQRRSATLGPAPISTRVSLSLSLLSARSLLPFTPSASAGLLPPRLVAMGNCCARDDATHDCTAAATDERDCCLREGQQKASAAAASSSSSPSAPPSFLSSALASLACSPAAARRVPAFSLVSTQRPFVPNKSDNRIIDLLETKRAGKEIYSQPALEQRAADRAASEVTPN